MAITIDEFTDKVDTEKDEEEQHLFCPVCNHGEKWFRIVDNSDHVVFILAESKDDAVELYNECYLEEQDPGSHIDTITIVTQEKALKEYGIDPWQKHNVKRYFA